MGDYMESQPALAKNVFKGNRVAAESLWADLAKKMNSSGTPQKDVSGGKKVRNQISYIGCCIGVKLYACFCCRCGLIGKQLSAKAHNKAVVRATGGGEYSCQMLSVMMISGSTT